MATYYFNLKGEPATEFTVSGEELVSKGMGIKAIAPDGIESWRLSYNLSTKAVDVLYEGLSEEDAIAKRIADDTTEAAANLQKEKDARTAQEAE
jgi:hypothetical protein